MNQRVSRRSGYLENLLVEGIHEILYIRYPHPDRGMYVLRKFKEWVARKVVPVRLSSRRLKRRAQSQQRVS